MSERALTGRTALVTGGARGIGRACCHRLAQSGANVAINYRSSKVQAHETVELVQAAGVKAHAIRADVSSPEQVKVMVAEVTDALGPIDVLVNNAAIFKYGPYTETTLEHWQQTLDVNLTGTYLVTWAVLEGMIQRNFGRIVNISSIAALRPRPMSIAYSVSKAGMIAMTKSLAEAVASHNIRVNAVAPGLIETEILDGVDRSILEQVIQDTPISRIGEPREVANTVFYLLSEESSFTTGQTLIVSGGRVMLP